MKIGDKINYNGHFLDGKLSGITTFTRRIDSGTVTKIIPNGCIEVTLKSGAKVCMPEERMKNACGLVKL